MRLDTLPDWARKLLATERVARLAYLDGDDRPRVLPVTFAVAGDAVWSAIDDKPKRPGEPARVGYLRRRPEAALLIDVYDDDWSRLAWVQLLGRVEVVPIEAWEAAAAPESAAAAESAAPEPGAAPEAAAALAALTVKYAQYAERPPPGPLLRLAVKRAMHWRASG